MQNIFDDDGERMNNIGKSAEKLGIKKSSETETKREPQYGYKIKKSCKFCWGRGTILFQKPGDAEQALAYCKCVKRVEIK